LVLLAFTCAHWTDVQSGSRSFPVMVQMQRKDFNKLDAIKQLYVPATAAANLKVPDTSSAAVAQGMVPLTSLVKLAPQISQDTLYHFNRLRSGTITATLAPGYTESEALKYIQAKIPGVIKSNVHVSYSGKALEYIESAGSMTVILLLSFVFIYLVLSAQFGSFIDPFVILLAVPLSLVGGLLSLYLSGGTLNLYSEIGLVTLVGMISKHGILITQFINDLRHQGKSIQEAIITGAAVRLRPILMTTAAMVFGTIPLAFASGPGSVGRHDIGWVIVGGLLLGTFFSLIVVPIAYSYLGKFRQFKKEIA
nr:efflux RND transporter permease subunit [Gammaproteobacteria bacterium]